MMELVFLDFKNRRMLCLYSKKIESALEEITQRKISINYAGRTDAGVHALSQVFDFETDINREDKNWLDGMNSNLPDAISIKSISRVSDNFHSRFSAKDRSYTFVVYKSKIKPLFFSSFSHWDNNTIDIKVLKNQAKMFIGSHDFSSFRSTNCSSKNPIKNVSEVNIKDYKNFILLQSRQMLFYIIWSELWLVLYLILQKAK